MTRRYVLLCILALTLAAVAVGGVKLRMDPPIVPKPKSGDISGTISPAGKVSSIAAVERQTRKSYAGEIDKETGRFTIRDLPGDANYDICVKSTDGREIEGIDLSFVDSRMLRLAIKRRQQLGLPPERTYEFTDLDVQTLMDFARDVQDFMDIRRVLYIRGDGFRATMLVELMRTQEFYASAKNQLVWRVELWYFQNNYGGWQRVANQNRVLRRERIDKGKWEKIDLQYLTGWSVFLDAKGRCKELSLKIPKETNPRIGRPANTKVELDTKPVVLGVSKKATSQKAAATRPGK